jgi:hypothetical protein
MNVKKARRPKDICNNNVGRTRLRSRILKRRYVFYRGCSACLGLRLDTFSNAYTVLTGALLSHTIAVFLFIWRFADAHTKINIFIVFRFPQLQNLQMPFSPLQHWVLQLLPVCVCGPLELLCPFALYYVPKEVSCPISKSPAFFS